MEGFRDFYPEDKRIQNWIFGKWRKIAEKYGYSEIDGPILEPIELYNKSGEEIPEQIYSFTDKGGRKLALRPETTPTVARMIKNKKDLKLPIKWYSISRCLRYERPQKGRVREFFQFNLDCLGSKNQMADAEVIATSIEIMKELGLGKKDFFVRISNRKLMEDLLLDIGIKKENLKDIYRILDKICKYSDEDIKKELREKGVEPKKVDELFKLLKIRDLNKIKINSPGLDKLKELFTLLNDYGVLDYCKLDLSIMRGFDYYTGTVFEVFDSSMEFRAVAGGGRYDDLAGIPGVGYGMGDIVIQLFLEKKKKIPKLNKEIDYFIAPVSEKMNKKAIKIADKLRKDYNVEVEILGRNLGKQMGYADSVKAKNLVIVGEKDKGKVTIRDMKTGKEKKVRI
ncbi:histidine--tRNA ligase [Candidatus Woesearchaeota archaeon]|nr:histidine--tRNA ligase [Candidatus Woesearchaeota archaeon]